MQKESMIYKGMTVAVVGLGITGQAAVHYCLECGAQVIVSDSRPRARFQEEMAAFLQKTGVEWEAGGHTFEFLNKADCVIVSPGIPESHEAIIRLKAAGISVVGELAVAAPHLNMPVVAVTGTNGKTTVTSLIGEIVKEDGRSVFVGGNIGTPIFEFLRKKEKTDVMVLEVSSFQLMAAGGFAPDVGVLLNITPDHIDRHGSLSEYAAAKMRLFCHQKSAQTAVMCSDDPECMAMVGQLPSQCVTFGNVPGSTARIEGQVVRSMVAGHEVVYDLAGTAFIGRIGASNAAAAILACQALGIAPDVIMAALKKFQPGPHRIALVGELHGVRFINDSKGTNTGAVIAALQQLDGKALLIAGGRDKGEDYRLLREQVQEKTRTVIVIGEAAGKISEALQGCTELRSAETLDEAVRLGYSLAQPGDAVLLSPACSSFDMFTSYAHRGEMFAAAVHKLIAEDSAGDGGGR